MLALIQGALFAGAVVVFVAAAVELRTALRLLGLPRDVSQTASGARHRELIGRIDVADGALTGPLTQRRCVMFSLHLLRRSAHGEGPAGALHFHEQRRFSIVDDAGVRVDVDPRRDRVVVIDLPVDERPLPFLPAAIAGLLVQRFGRFGQLWAADHVVRARETVLAVDARVHALVDDGVVSLVSARPLRTIGLGALQRGLGAAVLAGAQFAGFLLLR
jgi:hypothetical protein